MGRVVGWDARNLHAPQKKEKKKKKDFLFQSTAFPHIPSSFPLYPATLLFHLSCSVSTNFGLGSKIDWFMLISSSFSFLSPSFSPFLSLPAPPLFLFSGPKRKQKKIKSKLPIKNSIRKQFSDIQSTFCQLRSYRTVPKHISAARCFKST